MRCDNPLKKAVYYRRLSYVVDNPDIARYYERRADRYMSIAIKGKKPWRGTA